MPHITYNYGDYHAAHQKADSFADIATDTTADRSADACAGRADSTSHTATDNEPNARTNRERYLWTHNCA